MKNEIEIVVESKDKSDLDKLGDKAKRAGKDVGDGIRKGMHEAEDASQRSTKAIKDDLEQVESAAEEAGSGIAGSFIEMLDGMSSSVGGSLGDAVNGSIGIAKGGAIAAGTAVGAFILSGISMEMQEDKVGGLIAAQTGAASASAEQLGDIAGDVFADNFGESIEQVGEAMAAVFENKLINTDAPEEAIQKITEKVMTLSTVTGESFEDLSRAARQMVVTGLAGSVEEAMDIIAQAQELGLNSAQDLLDTLTEYGTSFRQLGLDGAESMGLINQAMEGGARNTDLAADALKEFSIRAQDMSDTTRRGFETLGLDADAMGRRIAAGGDQAKVALKETLNRLNEMPPSVERSTAAVDLFGSQAEDLAGALREMDLDTAAEEFGTYAGSVEEMARKLEDSVSIWDKLGKGISNLSSETGEFLEGLKGDFEWSDVFRMDEFEAAKKVFEATGDRTVLDELKEKYPIVAGEVDKYIDAVEREKGANEGKIGSTEEVIETLDQLIAKQQEAAGIAIGLVESQINYQEAVDSAQDALDEHGKTLDLDTEAGRANQGALLDMADAALTQAEAMATSGAKTDEVRESVQIARDQFVDMAQKMGMSAFEANMLANKLGLIPGVYTAEVRVNASGVEGLLGRIRGSLSSIGGAIASINWGSVYGRAHGGITGGMDIPHAASGGVRSSATMINDGAGIGELVELPNGSRVMTAGATRAMGEAGLLGGGSGPVVANFVIGGPTDELGRAVANWLQNYVKNEHGGNVQSAFGQRSGA